jgi:hypothetical protein
VSHRITSPHTTWTAMWPLNQTHIERFGRPTAVEGCGLVSCSWLAFRACCPHRPAKLLPLDSPPLLGASDADIDDCLRRSNTGTEGVVLSKQCPEVRPRVILTCLLVDPTASVHSHDPRSIFVPIIDRPLPAAEIVKACGPHKLIAAVVCACHVVAGAGGGPCAALRGQRLHPEAARAH